MRRFQKLSFCLVTAAAISLTTLSGCDLGTYSQRSTEYLEANPDGMKKEMKKPQANEEEETSAVDQRAKHLSRRA